MLFLTADAQLVHRLSREAVIYVGSKSFFRSFEEKLTRKVTLKRLSFIAQSKIDFLLPFTGCRKVLREMFALGLSRHISSSMLLTWYDWWHERCSLQRTNLFCCCCCCCCCCYFLSLVLFTWIKSKKLC